MPASKYGINLGEVYRTRDQLESNRLRRQNVRQQMDIRGKEFEREENKFKLKRERTKTLNQLRQKAAEGNEEAMQGLVTLAPEEAEQFMTALDEMDKRQKSQVKENVDKLGKMAAYIQTADDPERAYQYVRENLDPQVTQNMPEQYDPNFVQISLAKARELEKILEKKEAKDPEAWETRSYEEGGEKVTKVFNPDTKKWEEKRARRWKPDKDQQITKEDEKQARKRISQIQKAKAKLEQGAGAMQAFLQANPGLTETDDPAMQGVMESVVSGESISEETKKRLYDAWDEEEQFLRQEYVKTELKGDKDKDKGEDKPRGGATHRFVPGKGLVPIGEK